MVEVKCDSLPLLYHQFTLLLCPHSPLLQYTWFMKVLSFIRNNISSCIYVQQVKRNRHIRFITNSLPFHKIYKEKITISLSTVMVNCGVLVKKEILIVPHMPIVSGFVTYNNRNTCRFHYRT